MRLTKKLALVGLCSSGFVPSIFEPFGEEASWHSHENTDFRNIGTLNSEEVEFTQSLSDQEFVNRLLTALSDDTIVAAPYEQDTSLGYPPLILSLSQVFI